MLAVGHVPITLGPEASSLARPDDPLAWHDPPGPIPPHGMRRRRRIDVVPPPTRRGLLHVDAMFRDSYVTAAGVETIVHEYTFTADVDPVTREVLQLEATPRALPFAQCPEAGGKRNAWSAGASTTCAPGSEPSSRDRRRAPTSTTCCGRWPTSACWPPGLARTPPICHNSTQPNFAQEAAVPSRILDFPIFDADNHMYETPDALTKFVDDDFKDVIKYIDIEGRTKITVKGKISEYIPNPTFNVVGARARRRSTSRTATPRASRVARSWARRSVRPRRSSPEPRVNSWTSSASTAP